MKATKLTSLLVIALALTMVGTGCRKRPTDVTPINNRTTVVRPGDMTGLAPLDSNAGAIGNELGIPMNPKDWIAAGNYTENAGALASYVVRFDFDSSVIKSSERGNVEAVAAYLKDNPGVGLRIDGHCDERGTEGYNDALGERRAAALREAVLALGVDADRVITQSFGERKPAALGSDEAAYAQNRRGEFVVLQPN